MKRKTILFFAAAAILIAGAFVIPGLLLEGTVSQALNRPYRTEVTWADLRPAENTVEKLAALTDDETTSVPLYVEEDLEELARLLGRELDALGLAGAVPEELSGSLKAAVADGFDPQRYGVILPERHLMFEVLSVRLWSVDAELFLDGTSEKIISLSYTAENGTLPEREDEEAQAFRELQGWADYLELTAVRMEREDLSPEEITQPAEGGSPILLKKAVLTDDAGARVRFGQHVTFTGTAAAAYSWGPY